MSEVATYLKVGTTAIVLAMIEDDALGDEWLLGQPGGGDPPGEPRPDADAHRAARATAGGRRRSRSSGGCSSGPASTSSSHGLDARRRGRRRRRAARAGSRCSPASSTIPTRSPTGSTGWPSGASSTATPSATGSARGDARLKAIDLQYHDLRADRCLAAPGRARRRSSTTPTSSAAMTEPPTTTRAYFRGRCLAKYADDIVAANWDSMVFDVGREPLRRVPMMEPLRGTAEHVARLIDESDTRRRAARPPRLVGVEGHRRTTARRRGRWPSEPRSSKPTRRTDRGDDVDAEAPAATESGEKLKAELDDLLDEIDEVLETNAEDFVKSYVQKGGAVARHVRCRSSARATTRARASPSCCAGSAPARRRHAGGRLTRSPVSPTPRRASPCASPTAWSWPATGGRRRQPDQPPLDGEGRPGRPPQRCRDRRGGRPGDGDGPAVPAPARALREGRGHLAQPRGQGQPAVDDGPRQPAGGDAGPRRRADLRRLRPAPGHRAAVGLRRHRRPLRGARLRRHRLGQPARRHRHQARLPRRPRPRRRRSTWPAGRCGRPPTPTRPPAGPTRCAASTRSSPRSPPTASPRRRRRAGRSATPPIAARPGRRDRDEHAVLRRARAGDEGPRRLRPQGHRPRAGAGGGPLRRRHRDRRREHARRRCARSARSTTASRSPASAGTTSSTSCASPACAPPTSRASSTAATTSTPAASPTSTPRSSARSSPTR